MKIHKSIRSLLKYNDNWSDKDIEKDWKHRLKTICKPCWELRYCPYGPVVEDFPLIPPTRSEMDDHYEYYRKCLDTGILGNGKPIDERLKKEFEEELKDYRPVDYPVEIPKFFRDASCSIFGHICPVYCVSEPFTETSKLRRVGRSISFRTKARIARRDNYTCQICGKHLTDDELEFDHNIPLSRGGSSEESNLRLTCIECNRKKSKQVNI